MKSIRKQLKQLKQKQQQQHRNRKFRRHEHTDKKKLSSFFLKEKGIKLAC